ncbi:MAG TPA: hypothetical protein VFP17_12000 [Solirubrobacterales bacterium]|nr:hypothetical protein [Solirubrobacterales bacterium]
MSDLPLTAPSTRFLELLDQHGLLDDLRAGEDALREYASWNGSVFESVIWPIAVQELGRIYEQLELLVNESGAPSDDHELALTFAAFIYARSTCDGAQIVIDGTTFGDHPRGLTDVRIEPNAHRGDFKINLLIGVTEYGPNPDYIEGSDLPTSKTVTREAALLKNLELDYQEAKLTRQALKALGLTPVIFDQDEIERDPLALARRVVDDLGREAHDEVYPVGS